MTESEAIIIESDEEAEALEEAPTPEAVAKEWLKAQGVDPDAFDPKKVATLTNWERSLNKRSSELGAIAKQLESAPKPVETPTATTFDPTELANLKDALKAIGLDPDAIKSSATLAAQAVQDELSEIASDFFSTNTDITQDDILKELYDSGVNLDSITPPRLKKELARAYKVVKADRTDITAAVEAEVEKRLAALKSPGEEVVSVKKGRANATGGHKTLTDVMGDETLTFFEKMDLAAKAK